MKKTNEGHGGGGGMGYGRFAAMIATSTVVMFGLMYLNTYLLSHVFWSETRAYMALLMGATMAVIMLAFMLSMYSSKSLNIAIFLGAGVKSRKRRVPRTTIRFWSGLIASTVQC